MLKNLPIYSLTRSIYYYSSACDTNINEHKMTITKWEMRKLTACEIRVERTQPAREVCSTPFLYLTSKRRYRSGSNVSFRTSFSVTNVKLTSLYLSSSKRYTKVFLKNNVKNVPIDPKCERHFEVARRHVAQENINRKNSDQQATDKFYRTPTSVCEQQILQIYSACQRSNKAVVTLAL